ncbi:MAG: ArsR/SmtB family transcription factor [Desulfitobacteriaceae bacterium]
MEAYKDIQQFLRALADENRLHIVEALSIECKSVNELAEIAGLSQPLTSHHLKVLKNAGIARVENRASFNFY